MARKLYKTVVTTTIVSTRPYRFPDARELAEADEGDTCPVLDKISRDISSDEVDGIGGRIHVTSMNEEVSEADAKALNIKI